MIEWGHLWAQIFNDPCRTAWYSAKGRRWMMPLVLGQTLWVQEGELKRCLRTWFQSLFEIFSVKAIRKHSTTQPREAPRKLLKGATTTQGEHAGKSFSFQKTCQRPPRGPWKTPLCSTVLEVRRQFWSVNAAFVSTCIIPPGYCVFQGNEVHPTRCFLC